MAKQDFFQRNEKLLLYAGGFAVLYFGFARPLLIKLGLAKSKKDKEDENKVESVDVAKDSENPFSPVYWQLFSKKNPNAKATYMTTAGRRYYAEKIHKAFGYFTDEESTIIGIFRAMKNWLQVSQLADTFQQMYHRDLWEYMKQGDAIWYWSGLSDADLAKIRDIVYSKPKF